MILFFWKSLELKLLFITQMQFLSILNVERKSEGVGKKYQKEWEINTRDGKKEVALFNDCIDHSSPTGTDRWVDKYEVKWISNEVGYGLFAKNKYSREYKRERS